MVVILLVLSDFEASSIQRACFPERTELTCPPLKIPYVAQAAKVVLGVLVWDVFEGVFVGTSPCSFSVGRHFCWKTVLFEDFSAGTSTRVAVLENVAAQPILGLHGL
eukprot:6191981-Pleurochrysis_carterae.AAC.2